MALCECSLIFINLFLLLQTLGVAFIPTFLCAQRTEVLSSMPLMVTHLLMTALVLSLYKNMNPLSSLSASIDGLCLIQALQL